MKTQIEVWQGDITTLNVDAIVNAANKALAGGGGVDGAIHRAAGQARLQEACRKIGGCPTGQAVITPGFKLRSSYVIHTVGPVWAGGTQNEPELLRSCYRECLKLAEDNKMVSIAFPAISCGIYRYPWDQAVAIAVDQALKSTARGSCIEKIIFACADSAMYSLYREVLDNYGR